MQNTTCEVATIAVTAAAAILHHLASIKTDVPLISSCIHSQINLKHRLRGLINK